MFVEGAVPIMFRNNLYVCDDVVVSQMNLSGRGAFISVAIVVAPFRTGQVRGER